MTRGDCRRFLEDFNIYDAISISVSVFDGDGGDYAPYELPQVGNGDADRVSRERVLGIALATRREKETPVRYSLGRIEIE